MSFPDLVAAVHRLIAAADFDAICPMVDAWTRAHAGDLSDEDAAALLALVESVEPGPRSHPRADADIQAKASEADRLARAGEADRAEAALRSALDALPRLDAISADAAGDLVLAVAGLTARLPPAVALVVVANLRVARALGRAAVLRRARAS